MLLVDVLSLFRVAVIYVLIIAATPLVWLLLRQLISGVRIMGEATRDEYNPAYNHLVKLLDECQQKQTPDFVINGIQKALRLIEVCIRKSNWKTCRTGTASWRHLCPCTPLNVSLHPLCDTALHTIGTEATFQTEILVPNPGVWFVPITKRLIPVYAYFSYSANPGF